MLLALPPTLATWTLGKNNHPVSELNIQPLIRAITIMRENKNNIIVPKWLVFLALAIFDIIFSHRFLSNLLVISLASWLMLIASLLHGGCLGKLGLPASLRGLLLIIPKCLVSLMHLSPAFAKKRQKQDNSPWPTAIPSCGQQMAPPLRSPRSRGPLICTNCLSDWFSSCVGQCSIWLAHFLFLTVIPQEYCAVSRLD